MIFIDRNRIPEPEVFHSRKMEIANEKLHEFYSGNRESRSQKKYSKPFESDLRTPILKELDILFRGKCAYCESTVKAIPYSYDHFRPKHGARGLKKEFADEHYWWLTYEWRNFYYSCTKCNQYKATWFPVEGKRSRVRSSYESIINKEVNLLIDPCNDKPGEHLTFRRDGTVDFLSDKGKVTIDILKLDRPELVSSRSKVLNEVSKDWKQFIMLWNNRDKNWDEIKKYGEQLNEILEETSTRPYIAASKQLLLSKINQRSEIKDFFTQEQFNWKREIRTFTGRVEQITEVEKLELPKSIDKKEREHIASVTPSVSTNQLFLERLELKNFRCFDLLRLDLTIDEKSLSDKGLKRKWNLLLGENGVGKSSVLKAISIALMDNESRIKLQEYLKPDDLLQFNKRTGHIKLTYNGGQESIVKFKKNTDSITSTIDSPLTNVLGFGAVRLLPKNGIEAEKGTFIGVKVANLFDYSTAVNDANAWLSKVNKKTFDRAALALKDLMLLGNSDSIDRNKREKQVYVRYESGETTPIKDLSDGYQTIFALTVDIMSTLSSENVTYDLAEGVVIIDEIGTHLHPRWKMQVVSRLRSAFPRLQFIVSSHEPLCLRGLSKGETILLTRDENKKVIAITDLPDPSKLRVDQILTSDFFGLKSTMAPETESLFEEYYSLLLKSEEERTPQEKKRIFELNQLIPKAKNLGQDIRDELVYYVIDELLAKKAKGHGIRLNDDIKAEALKKVENIWSTINISNK